MNTKQKLKKNGADEGRPPRRPLPHARRRTGRKRQILALGRRQPLPHSPGPYVAPLDHAPPHHQRQGRLHLRQRLHVRSGSPPAGRLRRASQWIGRIPAAGMQQAVLRQVALRQRLPGSRHRRKALVPGPLPSGRLALPRSQRLTAHPAPPRLVPFLGCGRPHAAPLPAFRTAGRRHAPRDRPLQGLRTDVRALRRTALHRRVRCVGHRLQDRPLEYLAARQLVPTLGRDDARQHDGRRGAGRTDHAHGRGEFAGNPGR